MRKSNKIFSSILFLAALLSFAPNVFAADLRFNSGTQNQFLTVASTEVVRNLYAAGGQLVVNANAAKDAVLFGGLVAVNGNTADDLIVAGGNINLKGNVGGSARVAGGAVVVDGSVKEDLVLAGGNIYVSTSSSVGGDVLAAGGTVDIEAPVHGNVRVIGGTLNLNAPVTGNVYFKGQRFQLGPQANIKGNIDYTSGLIYERDAAAKVAGAVTYHQVAQKNYGATFAGIFAISSLIKLLAALLAGIVLVWLFRRKFENLTTQTGNNFWANVGWGVLTLVATPVIALVLFFTLIGYYVAFILLFWYILMLMLSCIIGATYFGLWLIKYFRKGIAPTFGFGWVILALLISGIITIIPFLGGLFAFILTVAGLGAIMKSLKAENQ